ncbi:SMI1/KNR4 family protein [Lachnospiraceae bacterium C1.1]|nr:SMI1/KNR4 family protein [Lachnospiraceae bacterium C1.1]
MSALSEAFSNKTDFYAEKSASMDQIRHAEKEIGVVFSKDYKEYLQLYGSVSCVGHELTGISEDTNLDVVNATLSNYKKNQNISAPFYVIEETHMDGIVIWQTKTGEVFQSEYKGKPIKIYDSLIDYISSFDNGI